MRKSVLILCILWFVFCGFILGIVTAFVYSQQCYEIFIDKSYPCTIKGKEVMTQEEIIHEIRVELDKIYEKYEGNPLIEGGLLDGFEGIIAYYYETKSIM